ncbi:MAG: single-stranded DNA-binding protein, partial [Bacteroidetes bacterium]|nr:single-stranded DNA-binding protein [Bacteroidota bacterium]
MSKGTLNKAIIVGRRGHDPDLRYTPQGIPVSVLNIATDQAYRDQSGKW